MRPAIVALTAPLFFPRTFSGAIAL